ncbi:MAG: hypothetical protein RBU45_11785 [Myxococcota bacterium]|jgi:hypothetical protein|nr:hypothetical protein [Myxococcota bacterium]
MIASVSQPAPRRPASASQLPLLGLILALLLPSTAGGLAGCAATCQQVSSHRASFVQRLEAPPPDQRPQLQLEIPDRLLRRTFEQAIAALPVVGVQLPELGDVARHVGGFGIKARSLRATLQKDSAAQLDLDLDLQREGKGVFGLALGAVSPVQFDPATRRLTLPIRADLFEKVAPKIDVGAADGLTDALIAQLPAAVRPLFPRAALKAIAQRSVDSLAQQAYTLVRRQLLTPLGELARFEVQLPDLPISGISLQSAPTGWLVGARTTLAARGLPSGGVQAPRPAATATTPDRLRLSISSETVLALGNWAMGKGKLPGRYTLQGKADGQGDYLAGVGWVDGTRPLKAHLWSRPDSTAAKTGVCLYARAAATPQVSFEGGRLEVGFTGGQVEEVIGPPLVSQALDLLGLTRQVFEFSKTVSSKTQLKLGRGSHTVELKSAAWRNEGLALDFELGGGSPQSELVPTPPVAPEPVRLSRLQPPAPRCR